MKFSYIFKWFGPNKIALKKGFTFLFAKTATTGIEVFIRTSFLVGMHHYFPCFEPCPSLPCATGSRARSPRQICCGCADGPTNHRPQGEYFSPAHVPPQTQPVLSGARALTIPFPSRKGTSKVMRCSAKHRRVSLMTSSFL